VIFSADYAVDYFTVAGLVCDT